MGWWETIKQYYTTLGEKYSVDPIIFVGIHVIATPLFAAAVAWLIYNHKKKKSIVLASVVAAFIFNAANIYLIAVGKNIPWWIYAIVGVTTLISTYVTLKKIKKRITAVS